jgi:hypothetical protein
VHRTSPEHIASRDSAFITRTTPSTSLQAHTTPTRASWSALTLVHLLHQHTALGELVGRPNGRLWHHKCSACHLATVQHHPLRLWPLIIITCATEGNLTAGAHRTHSCELVGHWSTCCTSTLRPRWVDQMGAVATISAPHATSPLCNTSHCLTGCTSSPAPLSQPRHWCTPHPLVRWLALALVHLLHQHTALGGSDQTGAFATVRAPHATSPLCNIIHCVSGRSSSPAPLCQPYRRGTPHPLVRAGWCTSTWRPRGVDQMAP